MPFSIETITSDIDLPVIDISKFPQAFDTHELKHLGHHPELAKLRDACKEWGFFKIVNHGIPVDLCEKAENVSRDLLSMPTEVKDKALSCSPSNTYYRRRNYEAFHLRDSANQEQMCTKIWPEGNPNFCETMTTYVSSVSNLAQKITKIILASLGLDVNGFYNSHFEKCVPILRINGYSSGNMSSEEELLVSHTDLGCITILCQDDVGGLQAWINGRYRSAEHRVVCHGCRDRMSIVVFTAFPEETEIWAPVELVDDNNPRRYKPFTYSHYRLEAMSNKEDKDRATALERFAGI